MKTSHLLMAAAAVAVGVLIARRQMASASSAAARPGYWTPQRQSAYRAQLWSQVEPDFYV